MTHKSSENFFVCETRVQGSQIALGPGNRDKTLEREDLRPLKPPTTDVQPNQVQQEKEDI